MRFSDKLLLGLAGGGAALWATRAYLRSRRAIDLNGKVVAITGASTGLGLLVARHAARQGARLAIAARDESDLNAASAELRGEGSPGVLVVPTDVSQRVEAERFIARTVEHFGRLDILVNNAGAMVVGPVETMTVEDFERVMATNFWGEVYTTLAAVPHMKGQGWGRIANVISLGGKLPIPHMLPYTASKFALAGFSEGLRAELVKDNIYVTAVYPGTIRTGGHAHAEMKGDQQAEYTWFSLSDVIPGVAASAERCAEALWDATLHGDPQLVFGLNAKLAVGFHSLFPGWSAELLPLLNAALPGAPAGPTDTVRGEDVSGGVADLVNRAIPAGTRPRPV
jgi:NAD(P)-dependent dehydrogenase (short-subunit alcohol dehydrogenase family)